MNEALLSFVKTRLYMLDLFQKAAYFIQKISSAKYIHEPQIPFMHDLFASIHLVNHLKNIS